MIAQAYSYSPCVAYPTYFPPMNYSPSPMLQMPTCSNPYQSFLNAMNQMQNLGMSGFMQGYMDGLAARSQMDPFLGFPSPYYDNYSPCQPEPRCESYGYHNHQHAHKHHHLESYEHHNHEHSHKNKPHHHDHKLDRESYEHHNHDHDHKPHLPKDKPVQITRQPEVVLTDKDSHTEVTSEVPDGGKHRVVKVEDRPEREVTVDVAKNEDGSAQTKTTVVETPEVNTTEIKDVDGDANSTVVVEGDNVTVTNPGDTPDQDVVTEHKEEAGFVENLFRGVDEFFGGKPEARTFENVSEVDIIHNEDGSQTTLVTDADGQMHSVQTGPDGPAQKVGEWVDDRVEDVVDFVQDIGQGIGSIWTGIFG